MVGAMRHCRSCAASHGAGTRTVPRSPRAPDLLQGEFSRAAVWSPGAARCAASAGPRASPSAALVLHVGATLVQWGMLRYSDMAGVARARGRSRARRAWSEPPTARAAAAALARKFADARHRAGLGARRRRAAAARPRRTRARGAAAGRVQERDLRVRRRGRSISRRLDPARGAPRSTGSSRRAGIATLQATSPTGTRLRASLVPGAELP